MICGTHNRLVVNGCMECGKEQLTEQESLSEQETYMSTASTEDVATDCITDDDEEVPPVLTLERDITLTVYNEISSHEWQASAFVMACCQSADHLEPPRPPTAVMPYFQSPGCMAPPPLPFPVEFFVPYDGGHQSSAEVAHGEEVSSPTYESSQNVNQWANAYSPDCQFQCSFQEEHARWPPHDGNHNCQFQEEFVTWLPHDGNQYQINDELRCNQSLAGLRGQVASRAFQQSGCREVQEAIGGTGTDAVSELVAELHGHVYAAAQSPHANHVIQKVVKALPASLSSFVAHELCGVAGDVARHTYGCRILCRIFEHLPAEQGSRKLAEELLGEAVALSRHAMAHHVIETILKHGMLEQRQRIIGALLPEFFSNAQDRYSSYVIESALLYCGEQELEGVVAVISAGSAEQVGALGRGQAGNRVLRALPKMPSHLLQNVLHTVVGKLQAFESNYGDNRHGKKFVQELRMKAKAF